VIPDHFGVVTAVGVLMTLQLDVLPDLELQRVGRAIVHRHRHIVGAVAHAAHVHAAESRDHAVRHHRCGYRWRRRGICVLAGIAAAAPSEPDEHGGCGQQ